MSFLLKSYSTNARLEQSAVANVDIDTQIWLEYKIIKHTMTNIYAIIMKDIRTIILHNSQRQN